MKLLGERWYFFTYMLAQGGKRRNEVMKLRTDQINWDKGYISFKQSKTGGTEKLTYIHFSREFFIDLKKWLAGRQGYVFINSSGTPIDRNLVDRAFARASEIIEEKVTSHQLRVSLATEMISQGGSELEVMKITGHASTAMIRYYDKSSMLDNRTKGYDPFAI
jgi:integrase